MKKQGKLTARSRKKAALLSLFLILFPFLAVTVAVALPPAPPAHDKPEVRVVLIQEKAAETRFIF